MARTFVSQESQIFSSEAYDDTLAAGATLQSTSVTVETDLNAIRSQLRKILWAGVSGSWYDAITAPSGSNSARGLNTINTDLTDLEQKKFLFRRQSLNLVNVATGSNFALLSVSLGTAPISPACDGVFASGSIYFQMISAPLYGSHNIGQISGSSVLTPKNLVIVRDAWTGFNITGSTSRVIYGLLQAETGTFPGDTFNDTTKRTQISFVSESVNNGTSSLVPAAAAAIGGKTIEYSYVFRTVLDNIPEDAYLSNTIFVDTLAGTGGSGAASSSVQLTDVTLGRAIGNQAGAIAPADLNTSIRLGAGFNWTYFSGTKPLWSIAAGALTNSASLNVDRFGISSSYPSVFQMGISVATSSAQIDIGNTSGTIATMPGQNLILSGGTQLRFADSYSPSATYPNATLPFATSSTEWNNFVTDFGNATSILGALHVISQSLSGSLVRTRYNAGVSIGAVADTNFTFPTNLDAALGNYLAKDFKKNVEIYLNGILLIPGDSLNKNDVYPGTSPGIGDLKFPYKIRSGSAISMVIYSI
jgi:hypothetical protein